VAAACRALVHAARWKGHAPHTTTGAANVRDNHCQFSNCSASIIAIASTGAASTAQITTRWRNGAVSSASSVASPPEPGSPLVRAGTRRRAVYPVASTVAIASWTDVPAGRARVAFSVA